MRIEFSYLSILFLIIFVLLINSNYEKKKKDLENTQKRNDLYHSLITECIREYQNADNCYKFYSDFWHTWDP